MIFFAQPKILMVGLNDKERALRDLPIRLVSCESGAEAASLLKEEKVSTVICIWDLDDMPDGQFVRKLRIVKPDVKTIIFIRSQDTLEEIKARSVGASVVLTDKTSDQMFRRAVIEANKLPADEVGGKISR
jgi:DNA-binding NarL/FixJ family response regulator